MVHQYGPTSKQPFAKLLWCWVCCALSACFAAACAWCVGWWRMTGSNRRPPACKAGALPAELIPQESRCRFVFGLQHLVGLVGFEPTTPALSTQCSNQLSYRPKPASARSMGFRTCALQRLLPTTDKCGRSIWIAVFQKGGDPAAPSDTATLLRLHPSHEPCRGKRPPCG